MTSCIRNLLVNHRAHWPPLYQSLFYPVFNRNSNRSMHMGAIDINTGINQSLNKQQRMALHSFLNEDLNQPFSVVIGPPGTGKTVVICHGIITWYRRHEKNSKNSKNTAVGGLACVSNSNIAIKHVAERLAKMEFLNFCLIVSEEFYFEWHEVSNTLWLQILCDYDIV